MKKENLLNSTVLETMDHKSFSFSLLSKNKASVIIFLQPECPFCNSYGKTLQQLDSTFEQKQVSIYAVVAGKNYPDSEIAEYKSKFHLQFPFLLDPDFKLARQLHATVTPQVYLLNDKSELVYHGMIDNWGYEIGKARAHATEFYLTDAIESLFAGKAISPDSTKAVGCFIQ